ncbi:MAG: hypothetical protein M3539_11355 [Acidobacteriota bacterium]|nr:hypothetical protein [Acidobacteriota bacterium]
MPNSSVSVRDVFALPEQGSPDKPSESWSAFQERVTKEIKGIKTAAMPDLAAKISDLLDVPIPGIFLTSWRKANVLQDVLAESKKTPEAVLNVELGEHTINSQHRPHIEITIQNRSVKKIEFILRLVFKLKGFVLKIQNGAIKEMVSGKCEVKGTLEYQGLTIAEKKLQEITLPGSVPLEAVRTFWKQNDYLNREGPVDQSTNTSSEPPKAAELTSPLARAAAAGQTRNVEALDRLIGAEAIDLPVEENVPLASDREEIKDDRAGEEADREQFVL